MENTWTMEEATHDFAAVAKAAYSGQIQHIKSATHPDLLISVEKVVEKTPEAEVEENRRFVEFLMSGPKGDIFPGGYVPTEIVPRDVEF